MPKASTFQGGLCEWQEMEAAGLEPPVQLLERCLERAERAGDEPAIARLMAALELQAYKIIGAASKVHTRRCLLLHWES